MMASRNYLFALFFSITTLFMGQSASGQRCLDSLMERVNAAKSDTARFYAIYALAAYYAFIRFDSSAYYTDKILQLSDKIGFEFGKFYAYHGIYYAYITLGNYPKAVEIALGSLNRAEKLDDHRLAAIAIAYQQLALVYRIMQNNEESLKYARMSIAYFRLSPDHFPVEYASSMSQIGLIKLRTKQKDSVMSYLQKGYQISLEAGDPNTTAVLNMAFIGDAYLDYGKFQEAAGYYYPALQNARYLNCLYLQARLLNNISNLKRKLKRLDSSIHYAQASLSISEPQHFGQYAMDSYNTLGQVYDSLHIPDSALKYMKLTIAANNSIFSQSRIQQFMLFDFNEKKRQQDVAAAEESYRARLRSYGLLCAFGISLFVAIIFFRNNLQRKKSNLLLSQQKLSLESTLDKLQSTQSQLVQAEKMASLGEITAGIAHEIQNPLNFVNNFSEVNQELASELREDLNQSDIPKVYKEEWIQIINNIEQNQEKINQHGKRADAIVKNMLQHSAISTSQIESTDLNALTDEYLKLAYYGFRSKDKSFNIVLEVNYDPTIGKIDIAPRDLGRALLNLFNNAFYYVNQKHQVNLSNGYEPYLKVSTKNLPGQTEIRIRDNGPGISSKMTGKIFQPFFTTKPTGQGTGLGLSLAYDIVTKEHGGTIAVESKEGEYTEFIILLPSNQIIS